MDTIIEKGDTFVLEAALFSGAHAVTGLTIPYNVVDSLTDGLIESGTLNEIGGGIYSKPIVFNTLGQFRLEVLAPGVFGTQIQAVIVRETQSKLDTLTTLVTEIFDVTVRDVERTFEYDAEGRVSIVNLKFGDFVTPVREARIVFTYNPDNTVAKMTIEEI